MKKETKAQKVLELYRRISEGIAGTMKDEAKSLGVSKESIKLYIRELREVWGADIIYENKRYKLGDNKGDLELLKCVYPITAYDAIVIMTTLVQAAPFMETKIEIIKHALLSILPEGEAKLFKNIYVQDKKYTEQGNQVEYVLQEIVQAISKHRLVGISYRHANDEIDSYAYIPYTLAYDLGKYYLIAKRVDDAQIKHLRLDRIKLIQIKEEKAPKITQLDITDYLRKTWYMYSGEETKVRVKFKSICKKVVVERKMNEGHIIEEQEDYFIYEFICNGYQGIKLWLMGFGADAEVLEPIELRNQIKNDAKKMSIIYEKE